MGTWYDTNEILNDYGTHCGTSTVGSWWKSTFYSIKEEPKKKKRMFIYKNPRLKDERD